MNELEMDTEQLSCFLVDSFRQHLIGVGGHQRTDLISLQLSIGNWSFANWTHRSMRFQTKASGVL